MKTYWDLTNEERLVLTESEFEFYKRIELMQAGVEHVAEPILKEVPADPELAKSAYYRPKVDRSDMPFCFATEEQAKAFLSLQPIGIEHSYLGGGYRNTINYTKGVDLSVELVKLPTEAEFQRARKVLDARAAASDWNEKQQDAYGKAREKANKALERMLEDRANLYERAAELQRIRTTFSEYVSLSSGDKAVALNFLKKRFSDSDIAEAGVED